MYCAIFVAFFIFHIIYCKAHLKSFASPFALYGIIWFGLLISMQLPIIKFNAFSVKTVAIYILAYIAFLLPTCFYGKKHEKAAIAQIGEVNRVLLQKIAFVCTALFLVLVLLYCRYYINYFGGLKYIFTHAYEVRMASIGKQIAPLYVTYGLSIGYVAAGISAYLLFFGKGKLRWKLIYLLPFVLGFLQDLITFSRIGTIFYAIIYIGTYLIRFGTYTKKQRKKHLMFLALVGLSFVLVLLIPKFIRSGGSFGTAYNEYAYHQGTSAVWGAFLHFYTYATGPLAAFGNFIESFGGAHTFGQAQLLPIFNLLYRVFGDTFFSKYDILYEFTSVPFETNIYTYLREAYSDFGIIGTMATPLFLGLLSLIGYRVKMKNPYLKVVFLQYVYLYAIFSVFYTPFSQGGVAFGMMLYLAIIIIFGRKICTAPRRYGRKLYTSKDTVRV